MSVMVIWSIGNVKCRLFTAEAGREKSPDDQMSPIKSEFYLIKQIDCSASSKLKVSEWIMELNSIAGVATNKWIWNLKYQGDSIWSSSEMFGWCIF